jgi:hypothetical protein
MIYILILKEREGSNINKGRIMKKMTQHERTRRFKKEEERKRRNYFIHVFLFVVL